MKKKSGTENSEYLPPQTKNKQKVHTTKMLINHTDLSSTWLNITQSLLKTDNRNTPLHYSDTQDFNSNLNYYVINVNTFTL